MIRGSLQHLADAIGAVVSSDAMVEVAGVGIDTREDLQGRLFIAIQGDRHDGHDHLSAAREAGAVAALVATPAALLPAVLEGTKTGLPENATSSHQTSGWSRAERERRGW